MSQIQGILFDLDGTLIDSESIAHQVTLKTLSEWGITPDPSDASEICGKKWELAFDVLYKKYRFPLNQQQASQIIVDRYHDEIQKNLPAIPGAVECVKDLAREFRLGLVSGSHRREIFVALGKLGITSHFDLILGAEDYPESKPSPQGYLKALKELGFSPQNTLCFEDSHPGIASARAAGLWVVAVTHANHFGHDLSGAHFHVPHLKNLDSAWVKRLNFK